jgi:WD40 repeat protein
VIEDFQEDEEDNRSGEGDDDDSDDNHNEDNEDKEDSDDNEGPQPLKNNIQQNEEPEPPMGDIEALAFSRKIPLSHEVDLSPHGKAGTCISFEPSGNRVITGSLDYQIKMYDFGGMDKYVPLPRLLPTPPPFSSLSPALCSAFLPSSFLSYPTHLFSTPLSPHLLYSLGAICLSNLSKLKMVILLFQFLIHLLVIVSLFVLPHVNQKSLIVMVRS